MPFATAAEVFPVETDRIRPLRGYGVDVAGADLSIAGGRLTYRLRRALLGTWVWTQSRVVTDSTAKLDEVQAVLRQLWATQQSSFGQIRRIYEDTRWQSNSKSIADFVALGLADGARAELVRQLPPRIDLGQVWAERVYDLRGWEVEGHAAISISISSRLSHKQSLLEYCHLQSSPTALLGLEVSDLTSTLKGEIEEIVGPLEDHRARLMSLSSRPEMIEILTSASSSEPVVHVSTGRLGYDYPISALGIIVRVSDFERFGVKGRKALANLKIAPSERWRLVGALSEVLRSKGLIRGPFTSEGNGNTVFQRSTCLTQIGLKFGGNESYPYDARRLLNNLRQSGLLRINPRFANSPIRIGIIGSSETPLARQFIAEVQTQIQSFHLECKIERIPSAGRMSRAELEQIIDQLTPDSMDLLLAILPNQWRDPSRDDESEGEEWGVYQDLKALTVGRGIPSQVVYEGTLSKRFAVSNVVLGILGKTGNIPFTLSQPLKDVDLVVGLDIARERKVRLPGSLNATAIARIYMGDGEFLRYVIHDSPLEGETIPNAVLQSLFPRRDFQGKRVIIHRDGYFRGGEKGALQDWARSIGSTLHLVEVIKSGSPRLYGLSGGVATLPDKGVFFRLSPNEGLLVSSPPPFPDATPSPLRIRTDGSLTIEKAIESVLALTILHYGSVLPPRLPVTIHYSDKIAYMALRGIKPKNLEGNLPFWL